MHLKYVEMLAIIVHLLPHKSLKVLKLKGRRKSQESQIP